MKTTLVIGASTNKERYSNKCIRLLTEHKIKTFALGNKEGNVYTIDIQTGFPNFENINTVAIYLSPKNQEKYIDYLISLKPQRILFPPGTENPEFEIKAQANGIMTEQACPLVMLNIGTY